MKRTALSEKIIVLGIDGMDPRLTKKFVEEGRMPNTKKLIEHGAQREDLVMLGGVPTITPPMWTTLATGANPNTHGITCFWNQNKYDLEEIVYSLDSRLCKAEQLWNVFAEEANKKTLVWHWPGSSWPPTSDNPNLSVVEGTQPNSVNMGVAKCDDGILIAASPDFKKRAFKRQGHSNTGAGCIITDMEEEKSESSNDNGFCALAGMNIRNVMLSRADGEGIAEFTTCDLENTPIEPAKGWTKELPADALEFSLIIKNGLIRRIALILKNNKGEYDTVEFYTSKKDLNPYVVLTTENNRNFDVLDTYKIEGKEITNTRYYTLLELQPDGSKVRVYLGNALDTNKDNLFHPKALHKEIVDNVGRIPAIPTGGGTIPENVENVMLPCWENYTAWQADCLNYLIDNKGYEIIFSHLHNVDCLGHAFWEWAKDRERLPQLEEKQYQSYIASVYEDTDKYIGRFMHLLNEGWTIIITSDHGLLVNEEEHFALMGDPFGINATVMDELGYTVLERDAEGNRTKKIDWSKTTAVASRGNHIWINLKGRNKYGIVDPADKYALEDKIIDDLYSYRDEHGQRIISVAMRNKEAALLGMSGDECGDIIYWNREGLNRIHGDSMSTYTGYFNSSVSPIFIAAGAGLKEGFKTDRVIREVDVAPTLAILGGVRMPKQCEGAPVYQIFIEEI
jgi:predicted AlkP superfamily phosphohydrolase/phosphomutase